MGTSVGICFRKEPDYSSQLLGGWHFLAAAVLLSKGKLLSQEGRRLRSAGSGSRAGCFRVVVPPCVLRHLTDRLIDSFRVYTFSPSMQAPKWSPRWGEQRPQWSFIINSASRPLGYLESPLRSWCAYAS